MKALSCYDNSFANSLVTNLLEEFKEEYFVVGNFKMLKCLIIILRVKFFGSKVMIIVLALMYYFAKKFNKNRYIFKSL